jgi:hypothetical protein
MENKLTPLIGLVISLGGLLFGLALLTGKSAGILLGVGTGIFMMVIILFLFFSDMEDSKKGNTKEE